MIDELFMHYMLIHYFQRNFERKLEQYLLWQVYILVIIKIKLSNLNPCL